MKGLKPKLIILVIFLFCIFLGLVSFFFFYKISAPHSKSEELHYKDKVKVVSGFYTGQVGTIERQDTWDHGKYVIWNGEECIYIEPIRLRKIHE